VSALGHAIGLVGHGLRWWGLVGVGKGSASQVTKIAVSVAQVLTTRTDATAVWMAAWIMILVRFIIGIICVPFKRHRQPLGAGLSLGQLFSQPLAFMAPPKAITLMSVVDG
jgi:hypothetical protein